MAVLVTGAAGFIGYHTALALLDRGERVIGVDNFNHYYDVSLKDARYAQLETRPGFEMHRIDLSDRLAMEHLANRNSNIEGIVHLAAQAGVLEAHDAAGGPQQDHLPVELVEEHRNRKCLKFRKFSKKIYNFKCVSNFPIKITCFLNTSSRECSVLASKPRFHKRKGEGPPITRP